MDENDENNIFTLKWEEILKNNKINTIFSHEGINNYTSTEKNIMKYYNADVSQSSTKPPDDYTKRIIIETPFHMTSVISYGLMVFSNDTKKWVIVQGQHTSEYLLIIKGYYRPTFTKLLLLKITQNECEKLKKCLLKNPKTFKDLYLNELKLEKNGLLYAIVRMAESKDYILEIINDLDLSKNTLPWMWPKGRLQNKNNKESLFDCAKREFKEEVEIDLPPSIYNSDSLVNESITTITGRKIESNYWIYVINNEIPLHTPLDNDEVSDRKWVDTETLFKLIPYSIKHRKLFDDVLNLKT